MQNWRPKISLVNPHALPSKRGKLNNSWGQLKITGKFTLAFFGLLLLFGGVATTGWVSLSFVRQETEAAIITSNELQRLMFRMKGEFDRAREEEKKIFSALVNNGGSR